MDLNYPTVAEYNPAAVNCDCQITQIETGQQILLQTMTEV